MAQYEVVKSPGHQFPVGMIFETDALHPIMQQHVRQLRGKKQAATLHENLGPAPEDLIGDEYVDDADEAFDLAEAERLEREAKAAKAVKVPAKPEVKKTPVKRAGPGENS